MSRFVLLREEEEEKKKCFSPVLKGLIEKYEVFTKESLLTFIKISKVVAFNVNYYSKNKSTLHQIVTTICCFSLQHTASIKQDKNKINGRNKKKSN